MRFLPYIIGFESRNSLQTIPDPQFYPRRPLPGPRTLKPQKLFFNFWHYDENIRDRTLWPIYGGSCFRPNIVGFKARDYTQTIHDPDLHPRRHLAPLLYSKRPGYFDPHIRNVSFNHFPHDRFINRYCFQPVIVEFKARDQPQTIYYTLIYTLGDRRARVRASTTTWVRVASS